MYTCTELEYSSLSTQEEVIAVSQRANVIHLRAVDGEDMSRRLSKLGFAKLHQFFQRTRQIYELPCRAVARHATTVRNLPVDNNTYLVAVLKRECAMPEISGKC